MHVFSGATTNISELMIGSTVPSKKGKWKRAKRGSTQEEKDAAQLAKYSDWVDTVLIPAGVDVPAVTGNGYAFIIGLRKTTIQKYNDNQKKKKK